MSQKCSKQRVYEQKLEIERKYDPLFKKLKEETNTSTQKMYNTMVAFKLLEDSVSEKTEEVIKKFMKNREKIN